MARITTKKPPGRILSSAGEVHATRIIPAHRKAPAARIPVAGNAKKPRGTPRGYFGYYLWQSFDQ